MPIFFHWRYLIHFAVFLICICTNFCAVADSSPRAKDFAVVSPNGKTIVRIIAGNNFAQVYGYAGAPTGVMASAIYYSLDSQGEYQRQRSVFLQNPVAPLVALVNDEAELITLDNWHNMGLGKSMIVIYKANGSVRRQYSLLDLYGKNEILKFESSVSSIRWRCHFQPELTRRGVLEIHDSLGGRLLIQPNSGAVQRLAAVQGPC